MGLCPRPAGAIGENTHFLDIVSGLYRRTRKDTERRANESRIRSKNPYYIE
jgi:hypothetical protein